MATYYIQVEEEAWKCPKHPYIVKRRRRHYNGVCPACLHDRLVGLRPENATSSSSDSSFSSSSSTEPSFLRRSRSLAAKTPASLLSVMRRSTSKTTERNKREVTEAAVVDRDEEESVVISTQQDERIEEFARMITRSRSVSTGMTMMASGLGRADVAGSSSREKGKPSLFRSLPSPMRLFRSSKSRTPKIAV